MERIYKYLFTKYLSYKISYVKYNNSYNLKKCIPFLQIFFLPIDLFINGEQYNLIVYINLMYVKDDTCTCVQFFHSKRKMRYDENLIATRLLPNSEHAKACFPFLQFALKIPVFVKYLPRGMHFAGSQDFLHINNFQLAPHPYFHPITCALSKLFLDYVILCYNYCNKCDFSK